MNNEFYTKMKKTNYLFFWGYGDNDWNDIVVHYVL